MSRVYELIRVDDYSSDQLIGRFSTRALAVVHLDKLLQVNEYQSSKDYVIRVEKLLPIDDLVEEQVFRVFHAAMLLDDGSIEEIYNPDGYLVLAKSFQARELQGVFHAPCYNNRPAIRVEARTQEGCIKFANEFRKKWMKGKQA